MRFMHFRYTDLVLKDELIVAQKKFLWLAWESHTSEWSLVQPFKVVFFDSQRGVHRDLTVPKGFTTDLASVPRPFRWFVSVTGRWNKAAVLHDYLYEHDNGFTQREADVLFENFNEELGVSGIYRWAMFLGVRVGGWTKWG